MKQLIGVILFLAIIASVLYFGIKYETKVSQDAYNNGVCSECGGEYQFSSAAHVKNGGDHYYYTCKDCGHTVMTYLIMK